MKKLLRWFRHSLRLFGRLKPRVSMSPGRRGDIRRIRFMPGNTPDDVDAELAQALHACLNAQSRKLEERLEELDSRIAQQGRLLTATLHGQQQLLAEALCGQVHAAGEGRKRLSVECVTWKKHPESRH